MLCLTKELVDTQKSLEARLVAVEGQDILTMPVSERPPAADERCEERLKVLEAKCTVHSP